jgi:hypothetical protein
MGCLRTVFAYLKRHIVLLGFWTIEMAAVEDGSLQLVDLLPYIDRFLKRLGKIG